jgi:pimeloyl-ACP methyl ester carboxylesterase
MEESKLGDGKTARSLSRRGCDQGKLSSRRERSRADQPRQLKSDFGFMQRAHARRVQLDLFYDYRTNVDLYPKWQAFLKERQPKTVIFWSQDDVFFTREGGEAYLKDLPHAQIHRLPAGHFAVEDSLEEIATGIHQFYNQKVKGKR